MLLLLSQLFNLDVHNDLSRAKPLQKPRTALPKRSPAHSDRMRAGHCRNTLISATEDEVEGFRVRQDVFAKESITRHHDPKQKTFIDVEGSKKYRLELMSIIFEATQMVIRSIQPMYELSSVCRSSPIRGEESCPTELEAVALVGTLEEWNFATCGIIPRINLSLSSPTTRQRPLSSDGETDCFSIGEECFELSGILSLAGLVIGCRETRSINDWSWELRRHLT